MPTDDSANVVDPKSAIFVKTARRRRWFWVVCVTALLVLIASMLTPLIAFRMRYFAELRKVQEEVTRIQAAGEPITIEDRYAHFKVPDGVRDITPLWQAAFDTLDERVFRKESGDLPIMGNSQLEVLRPDQFVPAEQFLANYDTAIQRALIAARSRGECRFPVQLNEGYFAGLPHGDKLRPIHALLKLRGRVAIASDDTGTAIESVEAQLGAARSLAHPSTAVEYLIALKLAKQALREIEFLVNEVELNDEELARLQIAALSMDFVQSGLSVALIGERGCGYFAFHHPDQIPQWEDHDGAISSPVPDEPAATGPGSLGDPADCLVFLTFMRDIIAAGRMPFPSALDRGQQIEKRFATRSTDDAEITRKILPDFMSVFHEAGHMLALRDLTACAIAARRYELEHGKQPASLVELVPEFLNRVPSDPFDGRPLGMLATNDEIVLYSIGMDRRDDGGAASEERGEPSDVMVRLRMRDK